MKTNQLDQLSHMVMDYTLCEGAFKAGIATLETLAGGPPSTDLSYVLPGAKSAVVFALALDQTPIPGYLGKTDRLSYEREYNTVSSISSGIAVKLAGNLQQRGVPSVALAANDVYREDSARGRLDMHPPVSLRYLAVASGVASFGLSGNAITEEHGACIILGAVVTTAELTPTSPLDQNQNYCDGCGMCMAACASGLMIQNEKITVNLGGQEFSYAARKTYIRCQYVCGGYAGLHPSGRWSTWSPSRFAIPENDEDFLPQLMCSAGPYAARPQGPGGRYHSMMDSKLYTTCGNCQIVCVPDKDERLQRYKLLRESGVVVQKPDGTLEAVTPEQARCRLDNMPPDVRALYEGDLDITPEIRALADQLTGKV
jgi:epoxyqueuosine reductase QueG